MTPEEFANEMRGVCECWSKNTEFKHAAMDRIMCDLLRQLGYEEGVDIFEDTRKWYA